MDKRTAEEMLNRLAVEIEEFKRDHHREVARESKLRADLVQAQLDYYIKVVAAYEKESKALDFKTVLVGNKPFSS